MLLGTLTDDECGRIRHILVRLHSKVVLKDHIKFKENLRAIYAVYSVAVHSYINLCLLSNLNRMPSSFNKVVIVLYT